MALSEYISGDHAPESEDVRLTVDGTPATGGTDRVCAQ